MWCYLIVSISDLILLTYFESVSVSSLIVFHSKRFDSVLVSDLLAHLHMKLSRDHQNALLYDSSKTLSDWLKRAFTGCDRS